MDDEAESISELLELWHRTTGTASALFAQEMRVRIPALSTHSAVEDGVLSRRGSLPKRPPRDGTEAERERRRAKNKAARAARRRSK